MSGRTKIDTHLYSLVNIFRGQENDGLDPEGPTDIAKKRYGGCTDMVR